MDKFVCSIEIDGLDELISSIALFRPIDEFDGWFRGVGVCRAENSVVIADAETWGREETRVIRLFVWKTEGCTLQWGLDI
jgi:hypothetical protein